MNHENQFKERPIIPKQHVKYVTKTQVKESKL